LECSGENSHRDIICFISLDLSLIIDLAIVTGAGGLMIQRHSNKYVVRMRKRKGGADEIISGARQEKGCHGGLGPI